MTQRLKRQGKKRFKRRKLLEETERRDFAKQLINGRMIKQVAAEYNVSASYGYQIFREFLNFKIEWKDEPAKADEELQDA